MAKRPDTVKLERTIHKEMTSRIGIYECHEVTIDDERVDYLILDKLRFALLNFMNTNIPRSEIESYFRSL